MQTRKMNLVALVIAGPTVHHHGAWRHPESDTNLLDPEWYEHLGRVLEDGKFDAVFFADFFAVFSSVVGQNKYETILNRGGQLYMLDPLLLLAMISRVTKHLGLGATMSTTLFKPFQIARALGSLNLVSDGRVAWNIVTSASQLEVDNFGTGKLIPRNERYDRADEVVEAAVALWESWEPDAIVADKETGVWADPSKVHAVNYKGRWTETAGPLTVPQGPHGHPVLMQAGSSDRGREFAARWAEVVFTVQHAQADMRTFYDDLKGRVVQAGRSPEQCSILACVDPIIGETDAVAREKQSFVNDLADPEAGLVLLSNHTGVDVSKFPLDQPIRQMELEEGSRGALDILLQATQAENLTLREAAKRFGTSLLCPQIVGTPEHVADQLQEMFETRCCDGFILTPTQFPGTFEAFTRSVVPILQKRGVFRTEYAGKNLRENLQGG